MPIDAPPHAGKAQYLFRAGTPQGRTLPPQSAAHDPPSKPREWLTPRFKEEFVASNDKPLLQKKEDTATTSMVKREALTGSSSVSLASCAAGVVSGALLASLSS